MNRLFGKTRDSTPRNSGSSSTQSTDVVPPRPSSQPASATETLHETAEIIEKRTAHIERLVDKEVQMAQTHSENGRKKDALECIKRKRIHEKELERLSTQKLSLMQTETTLQQLRVHSTVVEAKKMAAAAIERELKKTGGVDGADELNDKLEDLLADVTDVLDSSARPMGEAAQLDEAELLDELEELERNAKEEEQVALEQELLAVTIQKPRSSTQYAVEARPVPVHDPRAARRAEKAEEEREAEERELAQLAANMCVQDSMPMPMMAAVF